MAILKILHYPDERLRTVASPVTEVTDETRRIVADMFETMYQAPGIGLAATQVDIHQQIIVIDVSEDKSNPLCLINPQITHRDGEQTMDEGCLSVPGFYETVKRAEHIRVKALDKDGAIQEFEADGLLAVCIQHEMDHLAGKLFVDYLSSLKRTRIRKKLVKQQKQDPAIAL
ncbi:MAG: peptide deformylase [Gammaproteobacteria bacterium]|nr:peptide deformylase [Gammaproteobacteria bacterium]MDH5650465.1 peptide deformylase [Gammaproteobacteria bacterium]